MELREKLNEIAKSKGYDTSDETIVEMIRYEKALKEYNRDEHRWYTLYRKVIKIEDIFIDFQNVTSSGDEPVFDMEEVRKIIFKSMKQVYPKEVMTVDYVDQE